MKFTVTKRARCICRVVLILMIFSLFVTGCGQTYDNDSEDSNEGAGDGSSADNKPVESTDNNSLLPDIDIETGVAEWYNLTEYSSVVSVEKIRVLGTYHVKVSGGNFECLVLECRVLSDFYDKIQDGAIIFVPIPIETTKEATLDLINSYDHFVFYIERLYDEADATTMDQTTSVLNCVSSYTRMSMHTVLPIQNDVLSTDGIYTLLDDASVSYLPIDEIKGYKNLITNGMNLDTIETHFRYLKTELEADNSATNSNQNNDVNYD